METVQNNCYGEKLWETTYSCEEEMDSKRQLRGKLGHVVQIHVCLLS